MEISLKTLLTPCSLFLHDSKVFVVGSLTGNAASMKIDAKTVQTASQVTRLKADVFISQFVSSAFLTTNTL